MKNKKHLISTDIVLFLIISFQLFFVGCNIPISKKNPKTSNKNKSVKIDNSWKINIEKGKKFFNDKFIDDAEKEFKEALKKDPNCFEAFKYLCIINYKRSDLKTSKFYCDKYLKQKNDAEIEFIKGLIAESNGDKTSIRIFRNILVKYPNMQKVKTKIEQYEKFNKQYKLNIFKNINSEYKKAISQIELDNLDNAENIIDKIIEKYDNGSETLNNNEVKIPKLSDLFALKGNIYEKRDNFNQALEFYKKVLFLDKDNIDIRYKAAIIYSKMGMLKKASVELKKVCLVKNDNIEIKGSLGILQYKLSEFDNAITTFNEIIEKDHGNSVAYYYKTLCLKKIGKIKDALESCSYALELSPEFSDVNKRSKVLYENLLKLKK